MNESLKKYLQLVLKDVLDEFGHDSLRTAEDLSHLLVDPLAESCCIFKHIIPHVGTLRTESKKIKINRKVKSL